MCVLLLVSIISSYFLCSVYTSAPPGIHDFNDHLLLGAIVPAEPCLGLSFSRYTTTACGISTMQVSRDALALSPVPVLYFLHILFVTAFDGYG